MAPDVFLGRALMDPATGLPNAPYFRLIRDWEERRARRHRLPLRVVKMTLDGGDDRSRRALTWRLCRSLRDSDFLASTGPMHFRILLTSPDTEHADTLCRRLEGVIAALNADLPDESRMSIALSIEDVDGTAAHGSEPAAHE